MQCLQPAIIHESTFPIGEAELCSSRRHQFHCRNRRPDPLNQHFQHFITTHRLGSSVLRVLGDLCLYWDSLVWGRCFTLLYSGAKVVLRPRWISGFAGAHRPMHRKLPHSEKIERIILCNFCQPFSDQTIISLYREPCFALETWEICSWEIWRGDYSSNGLFEW